MKNLLEKYVGRSVGCNVERAYQIEECRLESVSETYFTLVDAEASRRHHFLYGAIVQVVEDPEGVKVGGLFEHKKKFPLVIKVGHVVEFVSG